MKLYRITRPVALALLAAALLTPVGRPAAWGQTPPEALQIMEAAKYKTAQWGLAVAELPSGQLLAGLNEEKWFTPAATTMLFTVAAAMEVMGPDHRFRTPVHASGQLSFDGVLNGDLILRASGDPTMGGRTNAAGKLEFPMPDHVLADEMPVRLVKIDPLTALNDLARQVAKSGVKRVEGEVLIDERLFEAANQPYKDSPLTPMMINDNLVDVIVTPGEEGQPAKLDWRPRDGQTEIENHVTTGPAGEEPNVELKVSEPGVLMASGTVPAGGPPAVRVFSPPDIGAWARVLFMEALERAGVELAASPDSGNQAELLPEVDSYKNMRKLAEFVSPPLAENCRMILKISHNKHADVLPLLMAAHTGGYSFEQGLAVEGHALREMGLDTSAISLFDGEGGPLGNGVSPRAITDLLRLAVTRPWAERFRGCLPVMGVDGALAMAVNRQSPLRGKAQAKTGASLAWDLLNQRLCLGSKGLAGYLTAKSGRKLAFAIYVNNLPADDLEAVAAVGDDLTRICQALYEAF